MRRWIGFLIGLVLLAAVLLVHRSVADAALRTLPDGALADAPPTYTVREFSGRKGIRNVTPVLTPLLREKGTLEGRPVTAYYAAADTSALFGLGMLYGGFLPWEDGDIVIDSQTASEIFMTKNAVGLTVSYNGRDYTVRGVYDVPEDLLSRTSRTGEPEVYLPLASWPDQDAGIGEYLVSLKMGLRGGVHYARIAADIEQKLGVSLTFRSACDFREARSLILQSRRLHGLLLSLSFCVILLFAAVRQASGIAKTVRGEEDRTRLQALAGLRRETFVLAVLLLFLAAGVFWVSRSGFTLFLPQDYITDGRGLIEYIVKNFQAVNVKSDFFLCVYAMRVKTVLALLDICALLILLFLLFFGIAALRKGRHAR